MNPVLLSRMDRCVSRRHLTPHALWICLGFCFALHADSVSGQVRPNQSITTTAQQIVDSESHSLILVEAQHFEMGAREPSDFRADHADYNSDGDDRPIHPVVLTRPFYIASCEVTRGQFASFTRDTGYITVAQRNGQGIVGWDPINDDKSGRILRSFSQSPDFTWLNPGFEQTDFHPVVGVAYEDAVAYCRWLSKKENATYRLPTEAEWECVCRAGTDSYFSFGDHYADVIMRHANIANVELEKAHPDRVMVQWLVDVQIGLGDSFVFTSPTASLASNPWGVYDMHGNVWEWCQDRYVNDYYNQFDRPSHRAIRERAVDPVCEDKWNDSGDWRVIRGGSWINAPVQCRSGVRGYFEANDAACYVGFRVVREADGSSVNTSRQRHIASERSLNDMLALADRSGESEDGHIDLEFVCEQITATRLEPLSQIQTSLNVTLKPSGEMNQALIDAVCKTPRLNGVVFRSGGKDINSKSFSALANHPELERVQITGNGDLDNDLIDSLRDATGLVSIHLQGSQIDDEGLSRLMPSRKLRYVRLADTRAAGHFLDRFAGSPLRSVSFSHMDDHAAKLLGDFPTLREIRLADSPITDQAVESIIELERLETVDLRNCVQLTDAALQKLTRLGFLQRLDLRGCEVGNGTIKQLATLNRLHTLQIELSEIKEPWITSLASVSSLRELVIESPADSVNENAFQNIWQLSNLTSLTLETPPSDIETVQSLSELPKLKRLHLTVSEIDAETIQALSNIAQLEYLTLENRDGLKAKPVVAENLASLCESSSIKQVSLVGFRDSISDEELQPLIELRNTIKWSNR